MITLQEAEAEIAAGKRRLAKAQVKFPFEALAKLLGFPLGAEIASVQVDHSRGVVDFQLVSTRFRVEHPEKIYTKNLIQFADVPEGQEKPCFWGDTWTIENDNE